MELVLYLKYFKVYLENILRGYHSGDMTKYSLNQISWDLRMEIFTKVNSTEEFLKAMISKDYVKREKAIKNSQLEVQLIGKEPMKMTMMKKIQKRPRFQIE